jgi:hypothetical protein
LTIIGLVIGTAIGATAGGVIAYNVAKNQGAEGWELFGWTMAGIIGGALGAGVGALTTQATGVLGFSVVNGNFFTVTKTMVLGHYGYTALATSLGYGYYEVSQELYNSMNHAQRWDEFPVFRGLCKIRG